MPDGKIYSGQIGGASLRKNNIDLTLTKGNILGTEAAE